MLHLLTTDEFADWFAHVDDATAEDVATCLEVVEQLGVERAPPDSRESLLWYEHPSVARFHLAHAFTMDLEAWAPLRDYAVRILQKLESPRFVARLASLPSKQAAEVLQSVADIKRAIDPRARWTLHLGGDPQGPTPRDRAQEACSTIRRAYLAALDAAGFSVVDVPAHTSALRELSRRSPAPAFRLLYGVDVEHETALFVLGEWLDRAFYGDSVRRAERLWKQFLEGTLQTSEPAWAGK